MGWNKSNISYQHRQAYTAGLQDFVASGTPLWSLLLHNHEAYEVYGLNHDQVNSESTKLTGELVKPLGWRFVAANAGLRGACHVGGVNERAPRVTGFSTAQEIADIVNYIRHLEAQPEIALGNFTLRILRVPWRRFEALWLSSTNAAEDIVIPYAGFPRATDLELLTRYPASEFLKIVSRHAKLPKLDPHQLEAAAREARVRELLYRAAAARALGLADEEDKKVATLDKARNPNS
jgi:hypothetical protein